MVQRHSAELTIDSEPGQGTTVCVSFPSHASSIVAPSLSKPVETGRRLRILLVDDDPVLIKSLQDTLQEEGHLVSAAHGGQAGIDAFTAAHRGNGRFDVVITDLGMPHVDGRKVAAAIKGISRSTPTILLTGWGQRMIDDQETPEHVDKVLSKPPRLAALRLALGELLP
jgi:CheY-like chemotaxis protein